MRSLPVVSLFLFSHVLGACSASHYSKVYTFQDEPVAEITAEYFDVAINLQTKNGVELGIEAAHGEKAINVTVDHALLRTLNDKGKIESSKITFAIKDDAVVAMQGKNNVGRIGKASREGVVLLNFGTFNVRVVGIKDQPTLLLEDPILSVVSQKTFASEEINEFVLDKDNNFKFTTANGEIKTISSNRAMIAQPEFEQSGLLSPRDCVLIRAGDFIYAKTSQGKDRVAIAHVASNNKVKMLSGFRSKILQVADEDFFWISPR